MHANGNLRYRPVQKMPALTDKEAWKKLIGFIDKQNAEDPTAKAAMESALKRYNLTGPFKIGGVDCYLTEPKTGIPAANNDKLLIQIHGGAYVFYAGDGCYRNSFSLSQLCQCRVLSVDYGMPPDHPVSLELDILHHLESRLNSVSYQQFPKAIEDVLAVYLALLSTPNLIPGKQGVHKPQHLAMYGMSAGGGLAAATVLWLKDQKQPLPAVVGLYTPWVELDNIGDSRWTNQMLDLALFQVNFGFGRVGFWSSGCFVLARGNIGRIGKVVRWGLLVEAPLCQPRLRRCFRLAADDLRES
jgi:acetyl esterase/lipase